MSLPNILGLRADVWKTSSPEARKNALQDLEGYLATQENRTPCQVSIHDLGPSTRGIYSRQDGTIKLNSSLIAADQPPYQAVETLFHEDRHAHQHHVVTHPELAENQDQLQDWQMSENGGYIGPESLTYSHYRFQPTEADTNDVARTQTDSLYQNTFADTQEYQKYKSKKEQERADQIEGAEDELGPNYQQKARQAMISRYEAKHQEFAQQKGATEGHTPVETLENEASPKIEQQSPDIEPYPEETVMPDAEEAKAVGLGEAPADTLNEMPEAVEATAEGKMPEIEETSAEAEMPEVERIPTEVETPEVEEVSAETGLTSPQEAPSAEGSPETTEGESYEYGYGY